MKIKNYGIYVCDLCGEAFNTNGFHERAITGFIKNSNGRHIVREYSRNSEKHICLRCVDSIRSENCNFGEDWNE